MNSTRSKAFSRSTNVKNNFLFLAQNFSLSLLRTNTASTVPLPDINPHCILSISTTYCLKARPNNFIPQQEFGLRESLFPLKIVTNELNIPSFGNLSLNKISLNDCQRFQTFIPTSLKQFYSNPRRPTCFPDFHTIHFFASQYFFLSSSFQLCF